MRFLKIVIICGLLLTVAACFPLPFKDPDSFDDDNNVSNARDIVIDLNGKKEIFSVSGNIYHTIYGSIEVTELPVGENIFWISMNIYQKNDKTLRYNSLQGRENFPLLYSAEDAYIQDVNGKRIKIDPKIYFIKQFEHIVVFQQKTVDLNVYPGNFYLRLNLNAAPPSPQSRWTLHLGKITIGGISVDIPDKSIIFHKGEVVWRQGPIQ